MPGFSMRRNESTITPTLLSFVDTETTPNSVDGNPLKQHHTLKIGCATVFDYSKGVETRRDEIDFNQASQFWQWIFARGRLRQPLWLFAHNVTFDLSILGFWELVEEGVFTFHNPLKKDRETSNETPQNRRIDGFLCDEDPPVIVQCYHESGWKLIVVDTLNYWRQSLREIGESLGCEKGVMPGWDAPTTEWFYYCRQDVVVLETAVKNLITWVRDNDLGNFRFSIASQSLSTFRHRFMPIPPKIHHYPEVRKLERDSYYGGRLEAFFLGEIHAKDSQEVEYYPQDYYPETQVPIGPIYELDIASQYPSVMRSNKFPTELQFWGDSKTPIDSTGVVLGGNCIAEVFVHSNGSIPYRDKKVGTYYPLGNFWTVLAGPELQHAIDDDIIKAVDRWAYYDIDFLFRDYVDFFWDYRREAEKQGNKVSGYFAKILMNSLYGKFGQKTGKWMTQNEPPQYESGERVHTISVSMGESFTTRQVGDLYQILGVPEEHQQAFPAVAAFVTSYGRELLRHYHTVAGSECVYYVSTDALCVSQLGYDRLLAGGHIQDRTLGKLSIKGVHSRAEFRNIHNYLLDNEHTLGCIKRNAIMLPDGMYSEIHFEGLAHVLHNGPHQGIYVSEGIKTAPTEYRRGHKTKSGWVSKLSVSSG